MQAAYETTGLSFLMDRSEGHPKVCIALIDGPADISHAIFRKDSFRLIGSGSCRVPSGSACIHATYVASILAGRRDSEVPGICPYCSFLIRPIFHDMPVGQPKTSATELALAINDCVEAGAHIVLLTSSYIPGDPAGTSALVRALDSAASREMLLVAAAGNEGRVAGSPLTQHGGVIPVVALAANGVPWQMTNLSTEMARKGVAAPGTGVRGLHPSGATLAGTSIAAPLVAGVLALLLSEFEGISPFQIRASLVTHRPRSIVPSHLNGAEAHRRLRALTHYN